MTEIKYTHSKPKPNPNLDCMVKVRTFMSVNGTAEHEEMITSFIDGKYNKKDIYPPIYVYDWKLLRVL